MSLVTVRMLRTQAGPMGTFQAGRCRALPDALATELVACGAAEIVRGIEVAMEIPVVETAALPREPGAKKKVK